MTAPRARRHAAAQNFAVPALLAVLMASGLMAGLLGDGIWDDVSWVALAVPLALIAWRTLKLPWPGVGRSQSSCATQLGSDENRNAKNPRRKHRGLWLDNMDGKAFHRSGERRRFIR